MTRTRRASVLAIFLVLVMLVPTAAFAGQDTGEESDTGSLSQETTDRGADDGSTDAAVDAGDGSEDATDKDASTGDGTDAEAGTDDKDGQGNDDAAEPVTITDVTSTLPVLGAGLTVSITVGDDGVSEIAFDPADGEVTKQTDHKVKFEMEDGETTVVVRAGQNGARTTVRTNSLANVTGPGVWSSDVFGNGAITIAYEVGAGEDGAPVLTVGTVTTPAGVTAEVVDRTKVGDSTAKAGAKVKLSSGDQSVVVWLKVRVATLDDGTERATLSVGIWNGVRRHGDRDGRRHGDERDRGDRDGRRGGDHDGRRGDGQRGDGARGDGNGRGRK